MEKYLINIVTKNQVLDFAASQLLRALELLKAPNMEIDLLCDNEELDGFTVDMNFPGGYGFIKGSNPRSVLFGVYRLMKSLGFRWIRPGKNGEVIPEVPKVWNYIRHWEQASAKLRAICIEGADSKENIIEMVDWMAKNFFNTFYLQSDSVFAFLERFYQHQGNPLLPQEDCTRQMGDDITKLMIKEMEKRGLILQQFGHGPTCEILGLSHWGWDPKLQPITPEIFPKLAQINQKRKLWHNSPKYTQLCYGQKDIQEQLVDRVVQLVTQNPQAKLINFFLSDHHHNFCECDLCKIQRPSDWYVLLLNKIDEKLTLLNNSTRIGFAVYYDLLWPPIKEKLNNPERFFLVACPVTRTYSEPINKNGALDTIPPYLQNISPYPTKGNQIMAFYKEWAKSFSGEQVFFEYHYMWDLHKDYSALSLAKVLHEDLVNLSSSGMSGFISCQNLRAFYPNALGMQVMGETLWNSNKTFNEIYDDHFDFAYGKELAPLVKKYFEEVKNILPAKAVRGELITNEYIKLVPQLLDGTPEKIVNNLLSSIKPYQTQINQTESTKESFDILKLHTEHFLLACKSFATLWQEGVEAASPVMGNMLDWARKNELKLQKVFDVYEYISVTITVTAIDRNKYMNKLTNSNPESDLAEI